MAHTVRLKRKVERDAEKLPRGVQRILVLLLKDLEELGPFRTDWPNYSPIKKNPGHYHCLKYHYVACWTWEKDSSLIEVYYAGSREDAPY